MKSRVWVLSAIALAAGVGISACGGGSGSSSSEPAAQPGPAVLSAPEVKASSAAWSFGVMGDTQWTLANDVAGNNPNGVSRSIIDQINKQFIAKGVKFVVQVGDLTESGNDADVAVRAAAAQDLYKAGIGFFPLRGNHETYANPGNGYGVSAFQANFPQTQCNGTNVFAASNCNSPVSLSSDLAGMSYTFDYGSADNNARFMIVDDWATSSKAAIYAGYPYGYSVADQQAWISSRLDKATRGTTHAFVFSHQQPMGANHQDSLFSGYTNANPDMQNAYFASLMNNGVKYQITGHDHIHQRSIIASPDGKSSLQELISASASSKFYTPKALNDAKWYGQKTRETSLSQELYSPGFYIFTVDGPKVTVDYYSDATGGFQSDAKYPGTAGSTLGVTPTLNFVKKESWGYSLNGKEFLIGGASSPSYTAVQDSFGNTSASILCCSYSNQAKDSVGRVLTQSVTTGWSASTTGTFSDILSLSGMTTLGSATTDTYTLSMKYDATKTNADQVKKGGVGIATPGTTGKWVNAVSRNVGGTPKFVNGPWQAGYELGTYGIDTKTGTAWAVVNYNGNFVVAPGI